MDGEFMAKLAKTRHDPNAFSELVFGTPLHAGQQRYALNATKDVNFLLPGNSWGKTEGILRIKMWAAWHKEGWNHQSFEEWYTQQDNTLVASFNYDVGKESLDRLMMYRRNRPEVASLITRVNMADPAEVTLSNGAALHWGSLKDGGKLVEAKRFKRIYVDEVGHIPDLSSTFDNILFPRTMGVGGKVHLLGTPKEYSDPYLLEIFELGRKGHPFYYAQAGSVLENEFWPKEEQARVLANPRYVRGWDPCKEGGCDYGLCVDGQHPILTPVGKQVLLGEFVLAGGFFFNRFAVNRLFEWNAAEWGEPEWRGEDYFAIPPQPGRLYHGVYDLGGNKLRRKRRTGSDPTVGFVIDYTEMPWRVVMFDYIRGGEADWEDKYTRMEQVYRDYRLPFLTIDATGQLDSIQEALEKRGVEVDGLQYGGSSNRKLDMLRNLQALTEFEYGNGQKGAIRSPLIPQLRHELDHYVIPDDAITQDCVMALMMVAYQVAQYEMPPHFTGEAY